MCRCEAARPRQHPPRWHQTQPASFGINTLHNMGENYFIYDSVLDMCVYRRFARHPGKDICPIGGGCRARAEDPVPLHIALERQVADKEEGRVSAATHTTLTACTDACETDWAREKARPLPNCRKRRLPAGLTETVPEVSVTLRAGPSKRHRAIRRGMPPAGGAPGTTRW